MWDASHIVKYALSGIMDHYNMDASELLFNAQAKYSNILWHITVCQKYSILYYVYHTVTVDCSGSNTFQHRRKSKQRV